jgi:aminobenzoyl-glutamate utilization protein A
LETRGDSSELNKHVYDYAVRILENAAAMHGCTVEIRHMGAAQGAKSDHELSLHVVRAAEKLGCFKDIRTDHGKSGGSEDYTYMMERVQQNGGYATFIGIGAAVGSESASVIGGHHTAEFDIDERCLYTSAALFVTVAFELLKK